MNSTATGWAAALSVLSVLTAITDAEARTIWVNCDKRTISWGLERARPGDTIGFKGTCQERVVVTTDEVTIWACRCVPRSTVAVEARTHWSAR